MDTQTLAVVFDTTIHVLQQIPDPISSAVTGVLDKIWTTVKQVSSNKNQIRLLFSRLCSILQTLKAPQNYGDEALQASVRRLVGCLEETLRFILAEQRKSFLKNVMSADEVKFNVDQQERNLWAAVIAFQTSALFLTHKKLDDIMTLQYESQRTYIARSEQQTALLQDMAERMDQMRTAVVNPELMDELLDAIHANPTAMVTAMQAILDRDGEGRSELSPEFRTFFRTAIKRLAAETDAEPEITPWTVTGYEVEVGFLYGNDDQSVLRLGRWDGSLVLLLELKDKETLFRTIKTWDNLRNSRIMPWYGASTVDNPPFIVLPYTPKGTLTEYLENNRDMNIVRLVYDIARSLEYMHSRRPSVVHGELRPSCIRMDEHGHAIVGLAGVKLADIAIPESLSRKFIQDIKTYQSPEPPDTPASDMYSFGMILQIILDMTRPHPKATEQIISCLQTVVEKCTALQPSERLSALDVVTILEDLPVQLDVFQQSSLFLQRPPSDSQMLNGADTWRVMSVSRDDPMPAFGSQSYFPPYIQTTRIRGHTAHPLRRLAFEVRLHDQGAECTTAEPRDGNWSWIEVSLRRADKDGRYHEVDLAQELGTTHFRGHMIDERRHEVTRSVFADATPRTQWITWDEEHPFVKAVQVGDIIALHPAARFPGWLCHLHKAEIQYVTE